LTLPQEFQKSLEILPLNIAIMQEFAYLRGMLRSQGMLIGDFDIRIAATALHHDWILLTNNCAHNLRIPNLRLVAGD
jgi:tRNA(fMet)-specific endonuclease VapC